MSYTLSVFKALISQYPTWSELINFLTSADGGQLRCVGEEGSRYQVIRYVKGVSDTKMAHVPWFRSVIWDTETHRPICVAPPKAESTPVPTGDSTELMVQDFMDGVMINVFHNKNGDFRVASRTQIGAGGTFYSKKTFLELFQDAIAKNGLNLDGLKAFFPQGTFGSFLLQHPEHRIVSRAREPCAWFIHQGKVSDDGEVTICQSLEAARKAFGVPSLYQAPNTYPVPGFKTDADLQSFFRSCAETKGWFWQGLVFKDGQGHRWRMRNDKYLYLRELRGSEATSVERFLRLRTQHKISEYLKHYGEERAAFGNFEQKLRAATQDVFQAYCTIHKSHEKKLADVPKPIQPFVFRLHGHYLEHLKPANETAKLKDAIEIVNTSAPYEQKRLILSS